MYDIAIIGAGPGGLTAGMYAARSGLKAVVLEKGLPGGQMATTYLVENWPGSKPASGEELSKAFVEQAKSFGVEIRENTEVTGLEPGEGKHTLKTSSGDIEAKAVIIASGARERKLGIPGEEEFKGKGVSYCATCDGPFFQGKEIAVIGGGNSAVDEGTYLARFTKKVHIIHRRDKLRADKVIQDRAFSNEKVEFIWDTIPKEIRGEGKVQELLLENRKTGEQSTLKVDGVFIYIGLLPNTGFLKSTNVEMNQWGFIKTNEKMEAGIPRVYAAGDARDFPIKQIVVAAAEGATAAVMAEKALAGLTS